MTDPRVTQLERAVTELNEALRESTRLLNKLFEQVTGTLGGRPVP